MKSGTGPFKVIITKQRVLFPLFGFHGQQKSKNSEFLQAKLRIYIEMVSSLACTWDLFSEYWHPVVIVGKENCEKNWTKISSLPISWAKVLIQSL